MKTIQPIQIWSNGQLKTASIFNSYGIHNSLGVSSRFFYSLMVQNEDGSVGEQVAGGNIDMEGQAYQQWGDDDSYAWNWIASQLNLTITGDYQQPIINNNEETV